MSRDDFRSFLQYIFDDYVRKRVDRLRLKHPFHHDWEYELDRLRAALHVLDYIQHYCSDDESIYRTFNINALREAVEAVEQAVRRSTRGLREIGLLDAFDNYFDEILDGLDIDDFPEEEYELLRSIGFQNPKSDLQGIIYLLKVRHREWLLRRNLKRCVSSELKSATELLESAVKDLKIEDQKTIVEQPKKSRRWFKGLGKIGRGAGVSIGDICLAAGILKFPVSPETQTWGAVVSTTAGVGMILDGIGELRGE